MAAKLSDVDEQVCRYIEELWDAGGTKATAGDTLSALQWGLQQKRFLATAWSLLAVWSKRELPMRTPPIAEDMVLALCGLAATDSNWLFAAVVLAGYAMLLRTAELLAIKPEHVTLVNGRLVIVLPLTKSGQRRGTVESVNTTDLLVIETFHRILPQCQVGRAIYHHGASHFRKYWKSLQSRLGFAAWKFNPYALRCGGATRLWLLSQDLPLVMLTGRWSNVSTARIYVCDGQSELMQSRFNERQRALISLWQSEFKKLAGIFAE